jgi:hypothetical protein
VQVTAKRSLKKRRRTLERICAWCGQSLGHSSDDEGGERVITHGICEACLAKMLEDRSYSFRQFLEELAVPVLIMGEDREILEGNSRALAVLGKERRDILGHMSGDVTECAYSRLPGGCGHTPFCHNGCVIRRSVDHTYNTGRAVSRALAVQQTMTDRDGETEERRFLISTERVGDVVFLRIEPAEERTE